MGTRPLHRLLAAPAGWAAAAFLLPAPARPQTTVRQVVPARATAADGRTADPFVLGGFEGRIQVLIRRAKLGGLAKLPIRRIVLRRDAQTNDRLPQGMLGGWIDLLVLASWTPRSYRNPAPRFAANHDPVRGPAVVYRGDYHVIDSPRLPRGTKVASFGPTVSAHIVLQTPIRPAAAGDLCLELVHRRRPGKVAPRVWLVDKEDLPGPARTFFGQSCWRRGHRDPRAATMDAFAAVGATLTLATSGPQTSLGLLALGASRTSWGTLRLPLDLGILGARGCYLYVSRDLVFPAMLRASAKLPSAQGVATLQVPFDARLVGAALHAQWMFYAPGSNALGLTTTNGVSVSLAAVPPDLGAAMVQALDPDAASGRVHVNRAPVLLLASQ